MTAAYTDCASFDQLLAEALRRSAYVVSAPAANGSAAPAPAPAGSIHPLAASAGAAPNGAGFWLVVDGSGGLRLEPASSGAPEGGRQEMRATGAQSKLEQLFYCSAAGFEPAPAPLRADASEYCSTELLDDCFFRLAREPDGFWAASRLGADPASWAGVAGGRTLLLLHGSFSHTCHTFLCCPELLDALEAVYGPRIIAFDHRTLAESPQENAAKLLALLPLDLEVDIIGYSRGGLVARCLTETLLDSAAADRLRVRKVVFVATPQAGSPTAAPTGGDASFLALFNRMLQLEYALAKAGALDNAATGGAWRELATETLAAGFAYARQAPAWPEGLPAGLECLVPGSAFEAKLSQASSPRPAADAYFAIAADYMPPPGNTALAVQDTLNDLSFGLQPNDQLVSVASAFALGPQAAQLLPPENMLVLDPAEHVNHVGYFRNGACIRQIASWLQ